MKKILTIAIVACLAIGASAQTGPFGVKAGLNLANLSESDDIYAADSRTSFFIGLTYEVPVATNLLFQPEIVYSRQGAKASESGETMTLRMDYLNVPLVLKYQFTESFTLDFGAQVGVFLGSDVKVSSGGQSITINDFINDACATVELGGVLGLTYKATPNVDISARWNQGFTSILKSDYDKTYNQVFQIGLGYRF